MNRIRHHTPFIFIFLLGFALRAQEAVSGNFLFLLDQGRDMLAVKSIVFDHHLTLIGPYTSLQGLFQGPLWYYLLAIPTIIGKGDPRGAVFLMLFISLMTIIVVYLLTLHIFGKKAAIIISFLFAICPEAVAAATYEWNPHPMWLLIIFYIFILFSIVQKNYRYHLAFWPLIGLMFHFQTALGVFLLISSLIFLFTFYRQSLTNKKFVLGCLLGGILFLPQIVFDLRHNFLMTRSVLRLFMGNDQGLFARGETTQYVNIVVNHLSLFYYNFSTSFMRDGFLIYTPLLFLFFLYLTTLFGKDLFHLTNKEKTFINMIGKISLITIGISFLYPFPLRYWFLTGFQSFYLVAIGILLSKIPSFFIGKTVLICFVLFSLYYIAVKLYVLYIIPPDDGGNAKIKGKQAAIDAVYQDASGKPFSLLVFTPAVNTDPYDYLIWWHGKSKYGYIPKKEKKGLFYLLIEPDSAALWSYKGWLETVIKTGRIIETKELSSGFIIQKRVNENTTY